MIFDALTYSILTIGILLIYAVVRLTLLNGKPIPDFKGDQNDQLKLRRYT